jgi:hypothetical protein
MASNFPRCTLYCGFLDRNLWIKQSRASLVECLKLLRAIKVVEKVLKAFLKATSTYMMNLLHAMHHLRATLAYYMKPRKMATMGKSFY